MWTGNVSPYIPPKGKDRGRRPLRNLQKRAEKRLIKPGYPIEPRAFSKEEIDHYFGGDRITCLLCGKDYRRLGGLHLPRIHSVSEDEYRERYGLPWRRGLTSAASHLAYSKMMTDERKKVLRELSNLNPEWREKAHRTPHRGMTPAAKDRSRRIALATHGLQKEYDYDEFLRRIGEGRTPTEVARDSDMPVVATWRWFKKNHPDYARRFTEVWESLSFAVQARGQLLGERFDAECRRLFDAGLNDYQIASQTGVTVMSINNRTKPWRAERTDHLK